MEDRMMKKIIKSILLIGVLPLACCCTDKFNDEIKSVESVSICATIPQTKVAFTAGTDPALSLAWESSDHIVVEGNSSETFTIDEIIDDHKATFTGNAVSGSTFSVYYPDKSILSRSYEIQVQNGNASVDHLTYNAMVDGLDSFNSFAFNKVNGAVKLVVKVPASVSEVSSISITSQDADGNPQDVFFLSNDTEGGKTSTLTLSFTESTAPTAGVLTAYEMVSWNEVPLAKGSRIAISLTVPGRACKYGKTIRLKEDTSVAGGKTFILDLSSATELAHKMAGSGVEGDPYLICDLEDMLLMNDLLVSGDKKYFKMMADVDMQGVSDWTPANQTSPYDFGIDFDGDNHTISNLTFNKSGLYAGFIGVLNGRIANVTFTNASITGTKSAGVVCGYAGSKPYVGNIENVNVVNSTVTQNGTKAYSGLLFGCNNIAGTYTNCHTNGTLSLESSKVENSSVATGGIAGCTVGSTFEKCSFTGTIKGGRLCGGIVGYVKESEVSISECWVNAEMEIKRFTKDGSGNVTGEHAGGIIGHVSNGGTITNCYSKGSLSVSDQIAAGIAAEIVSPTTISNCWSSMELKANRGAGGIVGRAGSNSWAYTANKCLSISNCVYWGSKIDVAAASSKNGSSGSIVAFTSLNNVLSGCWRIADSDFTFVNTNNPANKPVDQNDCNGSNWTTSTDNASGEASQIGTGTDPQQYLFPYWGKASDAGSVSATVSSKNLGWSTSVWNFDGDYPTLKNNPDVIPTIPSSEPDEPEPGPSHSPVRPSGAGWTTTSVMDGIDLYTFIGTDEYVNKPQSVYVADVDLDKYEMKFAYDGKRHITSDIMKMYDGAVISMNGAYETSSIFLKTNWSVKYKIANDCISGTDVPNWKNDGAICRTASGSLRILNSIFREADEKGSGSYGLSLENQRTFYRGDKMSGYSDVFSSGPLLIYNYNRLGETFVPAQYQSYGESALQSTFPDSEHPYHHQGSTHPRTVVALTGDNHLLMIVADGRFTKAEGFSAHALTSFIADNFDPRYALNMDGGRSTTLCVAGQGDPDTHVVNHPCNVVGGKRYYNHGNEREVTSHFYIVARQ